MTAATTGPSESDEPSDSTVPYEGFEVGTLSSDALRARIQVRGTLDDAASSLLLSVVRSHITAGRRYLRIDLTQAHVVSPTVAGLLTEASRTIEALGGMLVLESSEGRVVQLPSETALFDTRAD